MRRDQQVPGWQDRAWPPGSASTHPARSRAAGGMRAGQDGYDRVHGRTGQGCGKLETDPAAAPLRQGLMTLGD